LTGRLTADSTFPEGDFRNEYFSGGRSLDKVDARVQAILGDLGISREELPEVALRYVLSRPEVSTVIPGMRSVANVERNAAVGDGSGLDDETVKALKAHRYDHASA
jgi:aryl-alcohol dehydrogenase-like predicted oxidoreductase